MKLLGKIVDSEWFEMAVLVVIFLNSVVFGLQTSQRVAAGCGGALDAVDAGCLAFFVVELAMRFMAAPRVFFKRAWNWFDVVIVLISVVSVIPAIRCLRCFRTIRGVRMILAMRSAKSLRLFAHVRSLRQISESLVKATAGIVWAMSFLALTFYIYGVMGTQLFRDVSPKYFGSFGGSLFTLFQVLTGDGWAEGICRPIMETYGCAWLYFISFICISAFIVLNIVTAVIADAVILSRQSGGADPDACARNDG